MIPSYIQKINAHIVARENNQAIEELKKLEHKIYYEIRQPIYTALSENNHEVINFIIQNFDIPFMPGCVKDVVEILEDEELLRLLALDKKHNVPQMALKHAIKKGNISLINVCFDLGAKTDDEAWVLAALNTDTKVLNTVIAHPYEVTTQTMLHLIGSDARQSLKNVIIKELAKNHAQLITQDCLNQSIQLNNHHVTYQILKLSPHVNLKDSQLLIETVRANDYKSSQYLLKKGCVASFNDNESLKLAASNYNSKMCELLLGFGANINDKVLKGLNNDFANWLINCPRYASLEKKLDKNLPIQNIQTKKIKI